MPLLLLGLLMLFYLNNCRLVMFFFCSCIRSWIWLKCRCTNFMEHSVCWHY